MNAVVFAAGFMAGALAVPFAVFLIFLTQSVRAFRRESKARRDHARFVEVMQQGWETR